MGELYWDRRRVPARDDPALVVVSRRARRRKTRYLGRSCAAPVPVAYDYRGTPFEGGFVVGAEPLGHSDGPPAGVDAASVLRRIDMTAVVF